MRKQVPVRTFAIAAIVVFLALPAAAQATRTWVSGVGDDANPCSRTAPCKTFAGAISKTAAGGEINVLDPGGFGGVTITKSITISSEGFEAGVLVSGTNAIVVNAGANDRIILRGLDIEGLGTGLNGINFLNGGALHVEDCTINNFTQKGINFAPGTAGTSRLFVANTVVRNNLGASGGGISVQPGVGVSATGILSNTRIEKNQFGLKVFDRGSVTAIDTIASQNNNAGFVAEAIGGGPISLTLEHCTANANGAGIKPIGATTSIRIANCTVTQNFTGLDVASGGQLISSGNNYVFGNNSDGINPTFVAPK